MNALRTTLHHIANILSFEVESDVLKNRLNTDIINWEHIVKIASSQLVLTSLFSRLTDRQLINEIPSDLNVYLTELSAINRNRNKTLLEEIHTISTLLNTHNIDHVFLKGAALLAAGYYSDFCERLIGDIDILVEEDKIHEAQNLLLENNYKTLDVSPLRKHIKHRHLTRLIPNHGLGAIELHHTLLKKKHKSFLNSKAILTTKRQVNGVFIPDGLTLLQHTILSYQINDFGSIYKTINLKSSFDSIVLLKKHPEIEFSKLLKTKVFRSYFLYVSQYFEDIPTFSLSNSDRIKMYSFKLKSKYHFFNKIDSFFIIIKLTLLRFAFHYELLINTKAHFIYLIHELKTKFRKQKI